MNKVTAGDAWLEYIKQFPKLEEIWNGIPEPTNCLFRQQIDIFAGKYPAHQSSVSAYSIDVVKELLRKQREICANRARADEDHYRGRFRGCVLNKNEILNAPEPELPQSSVSDEEDLEPSKTTAPEPVASHSSTSDNSIEQWEAFCDISYYDLWAVRPIGDRDFRSQKLFHVQSKEEADALKDLLNRIGTDERIATQGTINQGDDAGIQNYPH